jgi:predicted dehydrogenase
MTGRFRIAMIGCGRASELLHLPAIMRLGGIHLCAVADSAPDRAERLAARVQGCRVYDSAEALVEEIRPEGAVVATPPGTHAAIAAAAVRQGIPVLVEKPLVSSPAEVEALRALGPAAGRLVMAGFNRRHFDPARRLRAVVRSAASISDIEAEIRSDAGRWAAFSGARDPLEDLFTHQIDLLRYLFGADPERVSARWIGPCEVHVTVALHGGHTARCRAVQAGDSREIVTVTAGSRRYELRAGSGRIAPAGGPVRAFLDLADGVVRRALRRRAPMRRSFEEQLRRFVRCARSGCDPQPGLADGIAAMEAVEGARRSAASGGKEVAL